MTPLRAACVAVLLTPEARDKAAAARALRAEWVAGGIAHLPCTTPMPIRPARPARPELVSPGRMHKRGRAGSARSRFALLHAIAHIELNAIDLAIDMAGRWGPERERAFLDDWLRIADEEAQHFGLLADLLAAMGGGYGDLPAHDGLWEAAEATAHDLAARLAVVPQVLEARGLDVTPAMVERFEMQGEDAAAAVLKRILVDEIGHVETGNKWFQQLCAESRSEPVATFRALVTRHFRGPIKPPFNVSARQEAGLTPEWYSALGTAVPVFRR